MFLYSVFVLYEIKRWRTKKKCFFFVCQIGIFFLLNWGKNILFGIGNGVEFRPPNRVIQSPAILANSFYIPILTGTIEDLSVSNNGELASTVSDDKSSKVFDVVNFGKLVG